VAWKAENLGLLSSPHDTTLVYKVVYYDDANRQATEAEVQDGVRIPADTVRADAILMAKDQIRADMARRRAEEEARVLLPTGVMAIEAPPA
jgi:hypothetical protein